MRFNVVPGISAIVEPFESWFLPGGRIVLLVPLLEIGFTQLARKTYRVVAPTGVFASLRRISNRVFSHFQVALRAMETINLRRLATEIQAEIHGNLAVLKKRGMHVGHVSTVVETQNSAHGHDALWRLINSDHVLHAAY